jgi:hypothetical protein
VSNKVFKDLTGLVFGRWTVVERSGTRTWESGAKSTRKRPSRDAQWRVRCSCGTEKLIAARHLSSGCSTSCGCLKIEILKRNASLPEGQAAKNHVIGYYKKSAEIRGLLWSISDEDFFSLNKNNCFYCDSSPSKISALPSGQYTYNGVDRVNNSLGYEKGNVVACCEICNLAKRDLSYAEFSAWLNRVARHQLRDIL